LNKHILLIKISRKVRFVWEIDFLFQPEGKNYQAEFFLIELKLKTKNLLSRAGFFEKFESLLWKYP